MEGETISHEEMMKRYGCKYKVEYADTFDKAMKKLDRRDSQRFIIHWIDQHLNNVDFSYLQEEFEGKFSGYVRFEWEIIESLS